MDDLLEISRVSRSPRFASFSHPAAVFAPLQLCSSLSLSLSFSVRLLTPFYPFLSPPRIYSSKAWRLGFLILQFQPYTLLHPIHWSLSSLYHHLGKNFKKPRVIPSNPFNRLSQSRGHFGKVAHVGFEDDKRALIVISSHFILPSQPSTSSLSFLFFYFRILKFNEFLALLKIF